MKRKEFMNAFRNDEELHESLTGDDRVEIFLGILKKSSDVNYLSLKALLIKYGKDKDSKRDFALYPSDLTIATDLKL